MMDRAESEKKYRAAPDLNYSLLADFNEAPDVALMKKKPKGYFEIGKIFEAYFEDEIMGTKLLLKKYYFSEIDKDLPDKIVEEIRCGVTPMIVYNKDGVTPAGNKKVYNWFASEIQDNDGKMPIPVSVQNLARRGTRNLLDCKIDDTKIRDLIDHCDTVEFQVPIFWKTGSGLHKKMLADMVLDHKDYTACFDIKTAASFKEFRWMFKDRYWIQERHYSEGLESKHGEKVYPGGMLFPVVSKQAPFLGKIFAGSLKFQDQRQKDYRSICMKCQKWIDAGKYSFGSKDMEYI